MTDVRPPIPGINLKACRTTAKLTQTELAFLCSLSSSVLGHLETGHSAFTAGRMNNITKCLGVTAEDLNLVPEVFAADILPTAVENLKGRMSQHNRLLNQDMDYINLKLDQSELPSVEQPTFPPLLKLVTPSDESNAVLFGFDVSGYIRLVQNKQSIQVNYGDAEIIGLMAQAMRRS